jgi:hypothetical protein
MRIYIYISILFLWYTARVSFRGVVVSTAKPHAVIEIDITGGKYVVFAKVIR